MQSCFRLIAFDADDTLWHNETFYRQGREYFMNLLATYTKPELAGQKLDQIETTNVEFFGYGIKSFILSMIETALQVTNGSIDCNVIAEIIDYAKEMLKADPTHFPETMNTLERLSSRYDLMLITKGDLFEQERKVARSGLDSYFRYIEVVSEKKPQTYRGILEKYSIKPSEFLMIGNSLRSDILPVVEIGAHAIYIPYHLTWDHEKILDRPLEKHEYNQLEHIGQVPEFIEGLIDCS